MKVASGNVADSPFARTVYSLATNRFTGDLVLHHKRRETKVVWTEGQIVAAHSSSPADAPGRQALAHGLLNSSTLGIFVQQMGETPEQDPIALLTQLGNLTPEQAITLKHHILIRSASRIFGLPNATFVVDNFPTIPADPDLPALDARWLIYFGLRTHYSASRLAEELSALGQRTVALSPDAAAALPYFGFGDYEQHILSRLQGGPHTLADLLACGLDKNITNCLVYSLVAAGCIVYGVAPAIASVPGTSAVASYGTVQGIGFVDPTGLAVPAVPTPVPEDAPSQQPSQQPSRASNRFSAAENAAETAVRTPPPGYDPAETAATIALVKDKLKVIDADGSHYQMLGVEQEVPDSVVRKAYFALARRLHPDHLQSLGVEDMADDIQHVFAAINEAFKILSSPKDLAKYRTILAAGGQKAYSAKQAKAEKMALGVFEAEENFHLGEMALRRDQFANAEKCFAKACELQPEEGEYQALHAWAMYCNADDRKLVESDALAKMSSALLRNSKSVAIRLYHAKLLKILGRNKEALASFDVLLRMSPGHREAELELRVLREAMESSKPKKGFFGR